MLMDAGFEPVDPGIFFYELFIINILSELVFCKPKQRYLFLFVYFNVVVIN